jgi:hypothetical protein
MPEHVRVDLEIEASAFGYAFDQPINRIRRKWSTALSGKGKAAQPATGRPVGP